MFSILACTILISCSRKGKNSPNDSRKLYKAYHGESWNDVYVIRGDTSVSLTVVNKEQGHVPLISYFGLRKGLPSFAYVHARQDSFGLRIYYNSEGEIQSIHDSGFLSTKKGYAPLIYNFTKEDSIYTKKVSDGFGKLKIKYYLYLNRAEYEFSIYKNRALLNMIDRNDLIDRMILSETEYSNFVVLADSINLALDNADIDWQEDNSGLRAYRGKKPLN